MPDNFLYRPTTINRVVFPYTFPMSATVPITIAWPFAGKYTTRVYALHTINIAYIKQKRPFDWGVCERVYSLYGPCVF